MQSYGVWNESDPQTLRLACSSTVCETLPFVSEGTFKKIEEGGGDLTVAKTDWQINLSDQILSTMPYYSVNFII